MKPLLALSAALSFRSIAAATMSVTYEHSKSPINSTIISRDVNYAHGICHFHAQIIQNCCRTFGSGPKHATYVDIFTINDGNGQAIPGLGGDMGSRKDLHKCGYEETGPVETITGMEKTMEYEWVEWTDEDDSMYQKMTYRYDNCYWDERAHTVLPEDPRPATAPNTSPGAVVGLGLRTLCVVRIDGQLRTLKDVPRCLQSGIGRGSVGKRACTIAYAQRGG
ncbi:hypothetical protein BDV96DRAFT_603192 [Lophiotrema nucula]|uniref:Uncharacterized protein n=1 Tax=Lophiotrema nucula TaxID=690887 RepID=A0A6A5YW10_9PLEO|nr:hypothetical protein BDV96DRAFT_603192 [Lophiotrema nucula]